MKIEKLLTLSQFVDLHAEKWALVRAYNNFLKQPLTKEMFVNEFIHPDLMAVRWSCKKGNPFYEDHLIRHKEAEKKVIFSTPNEFENVDIIIIAAKTIGGYANAMNGELTLKNVTI